MSLFRIRKEVDYYIQELIDNEKQLHDMTENNKDPYDIKKFEEVVGESRMMVPDSQKRLAAAIVDLKQFMEQEKVTTTASDDGEWIKAARKVLEQEAADQEEGSSSTAIMDQAPSTNVDNLGKGEAF